MQIGKRRFEYGNTYIMGILNMTPDSFSDGGSYKSDDDALRAVERMINEGAAVIDVGGESTRPGFVPVDAASEIRRTAGIIKKIKSTFDVPVSIDTMKASVAGEAIAAGADMLNYVGDLCTDRQMASVMAESSLPCVLTHTRPEPYSGPEPFSQVVEREVGQILEAADAAGIKKDRIILDPGIGFGKTCEQNLMMLASKSFMMPGGYEVLLGASRKSVIGTVLDLPVADRLEGTLVTTLIAAQQEALFVRVHDIKENYRALKMYGSIRKARSTACANEVEGCVIQRPDGSEV